MDLDHSIQIDPKWTLPNKNLMLDHIEVCENQMEEPKIDKTYLQKNPVRKTERDF